MKYSSVFTVLLIVSLFSSCQKESSTPQPQQNCRLISYGVEGGITLTYAYSTDNKIIGVTTSDGYGYKLVYTANHADLYRIAKTGVTSTTAVSNLTLNNNGYVVQAKYVNALNKSYTVTNSYTSDGYLISQQSNDSGMLMNTKLDNLGNPSSATTISTMSNYVYGISTYEFYLDKANQLPPPVPFYYLLTLQPGFAPFYDYSIITGDLLIGMAGKASPNLLKKVSTPDLITSTGFGAISYEFTYEFDKDGKVVRINAINTYPNHAPVPSTITLKYDCL